MKKLLAAAVVMIFMSCSGETSSDKYMDEHSSDSTDSSQENVNRDTSMAKDTVYPQSDTSSYRRDTSQQGRRQNR